MKIKELHIQNFRGFEDVTIHFPESNVCVFIGANGSGKSSVLEVISNLLSMLFLNSLENSEDKVIENVRKLSYFDRFDFSKENIKSIQNGANLIAYIDYLENKNVEINKIVSNSNVTFRGVSKGFHLIVDELKKNITNFYPLFLKYSIQRFSIGKEEVFKDKSIFTELSKNFIDFNEFISWFKDLEDKENAEKIAFRNFNYNNLLLEYIRKVIKDFLSELNQKNFENLKVFREETTIETAVNGKKETTLTIDKNGIPLKLQQLSDGEKLILMTVCDIARKLILLNPKLENPLLGEGIILIDEIELHLHPQWQRNVIPALRKTFPNIQFIITTHSPQVLSNIDKSEIRVLKDWQVYEPSSETLGSDTNYILESIMETDKSPAEDELREVFKLINDKKFVEAEIIANKLVADKKISANNFVFQRIESFKERMAILSK